jgi:hypothetical protein
VVVAEEQGPVLPLGMLLQLGLLTLVVEVVAVIMEIVIMLTQELVVQVSL